MNIVFVHGRSQQLKDPDKLHASWMSALETGMSGASLPKNVQTTFPYYGNVLATRENELFDQRKRGFQQMGEYEKFVGEFVAEVITTYKSNHDDVDCDSELFRNSTRGPLNWGWVQKGLEFIDKKLPAVGRQTVQKRTRDVYVYLTNRDVRDEVNGVVRQAITGDEAVIVSHSLGTIVAYDVLSRIENVKVPLLVTLGSPLGVRSVLKLLKNHSDLEFPQAVASWLNAFDTRDVVALLPVSSAEFPGGKIENYPDVRNNTSNRHGITGYLDNTDIANRISHAVHHSGDE